jgi:hypothetical protein
VSKKEYFLIELDYHRHLREHQDLVLAYLFAEELLKFMEGEYGLYQKLVKVHAFILLFQCGKAKTKINNT